MRSASPQARVGSEGTIGSLLRKLSPRRRDSDEDLKETFFQAKVQIHCHLPCFCHICLSLPDHQLPTRVRSEHLRCDWYLSCLNNRDCADLVAEISEHGLAFYNLGGPGAERGRFAVRAIILLALVISRRIALYY